MVRNDNTINQTTISYIALSVNSFTILIYRQSLYLKQSKMSNFRFPAIDSKKSLGDDDDYNFVNKDKKKKISSSTPLEVVEELKRKIQEQRRQIESRNITIQGLQRNFESLSSIVKNEKATSAILREELEGYKRNQQSGDKRASQFHEKCIVLQKENKKLKEELNQVSKAHASCGDYVSLSERLKDQVNSLEEKNENFLKKITDLDGKKTSLQKQLQSYKDVAQQRNKLLEKQRQLQTQLEAEFKAKKQLQNSQDLLKSQVASLKEQILKEQKERSANRQKYLNSEKNTEMIKGEVKRLEQVIQNLKGELGEMKKLTENKDLYNQMKEQTEIKLKKQIEQLKQDLELCNKNLGDSKAKNEDLGSQLSERQNMISKNKEEILGLQNQVIDLKRIQQQRGQQHQEEIAKIKHSMAELKTTIDILTGQRQSLNSKLQQESKRAQSYNEKVSNLNSDLSNLNTNMQQLNKKYGNYLKEIEKNLPNVVITNEEEFTKMQKDSSSLIKEITNLKVEISKKDENEVTMKKYIANLEAEVKTRSEEIINLSKKLHKYELQEEELSKVLENERKRFDQLAKQTEQEKLRSKRQIENILSEKQQQLEREKQQKEKFLSEKELAEKQWRQKQLLKQKQAQEYKLKLQQYEKEEQELKQLMKREQAEIDRLKAEKQAQISRLMKQKQSEVEKEKKNNQVLWADNKKLKEYQENLKKEAQKQLEELEIAKKRQMQEIRRQMEEKLKREVSGQESNSKELKKILLEKANQMKAMTESYNQMQNDTSKLKKQIGRLSQESEFHKNRSKDIEGVFSRAQKSYKEKIAQFEVQAKCHKQVVAVFEKKQKKAAQEMKDMEVKLLSVEKELFRLKKKYEGQKIEQKLQLISKTVGDMDLSLKTLLNTFSCNYCVEVVKDCVRLEECGHIYCMKCKAGYQPNCGECKKKGTAKKDKNINESVTKAEYMKILLNTIKEDLDKISL